MISKPFPFLEQLANVHAWCRIYLRTLRYSEFINWVSDSIFGHFLKNALISDDNTLIRELEEKLHKQQKDAARRENTLVHRLTTKEQELQDYLVSDNIYVIKVVL